MRSVDRNDPHKKVERDWQEDEDAVLSSFNKKEIGESDEDEDDQNTDDEQVELKFFSLKKIIELFTGMEQLTSL